MEKVLYSGLASAFTASSDFDLSEAIGGIFIDNQSDIAITLELKAIRSNEVYDVLDPSDSASTVVVTIPIATKKFLGLGDLPSYNWYRFTGDGSTATSGNLNIYVNGENAKSR